MNKKFYSGENHIIARYLKILDRTQKTRRYKKSFTYNLEQLQEFKKQPSKNYSIEDKVNVMKELCNNLDFEINSIHNGVKFHLKYKDISNMFISIFKTGELMIIYSEKNVIDDMKMSLYLIDDFKNRYKDFNGYCEFIFAKHLIQDSTLDNIKKNLLNRFPNYSSPYGMPNIKRAKQEQFKKRILINNLFNINSYDDIEIKRVSSLEKDWVESLDKSEEINEFLENEFKKYNLTKKEILKEHLDKCLKYTNFTYNNVENRNGISIYNNIQNQFEILSKKMISEEKSKEIIKNFDNIKPNTYSEEKFLYDSERKKIEQTSIFGF